MQSRESGVQLSEISARLRRSRTVAVWIAWGACIAITALLAAYSVKSDFDRLRLNTASSLVVVSNDGRVASFIMNRKQTQDLLVIINSRTTNTYKRRSVKYKYWVNVICRDERSICLRNVWVHKSSEAESADVLVDLISIAKSGIPNDVSDHSTFCKQGPITERVF